MSENQPDVQQVKWYEKRPVVIALLVFFFPAGLYAMWKGGHFSKKTRIIVTVACVVSALAFAAQAATSQPKAWTPTPDWFSMTEDADFEACTYGFGRSSDMIGPGHRLVLSPPMKADGQYYTMQGKIIGVEGKWFTAILAGQGNYVFTFKLHKSMPEPPFRFNALITVCGKFIGLTDGLAFSDSSYMPEFEAVCVKLWGLY